MSSNPHPVALRQVLSAGSRGLASRLGAGRLPHFSPTFERTLLSTYFTSKPDPQRRVRQPADSLAYMSIWYDSVRELGLHGRVFHDGLSDAFSARYATERVRFLQVPRWYSRSTNDHRFLVYRAYLRSYHAQDVFMTDIADVKVARDPFALCESGRLYVGADRWLLGENRWLRALAERIGDRRYLAFLDDHAERPTVNAGVLGGETGLVSEFVERMIAEFARIGRPWVNANMMVFNYVAYTGYEDRIGSELCSRYKAFELDRVDVPFIHK
ncbi:MAG: hypothetical protein QNK05_11380 [Myxococcota bacterium]|nr:hypothetical protein [Myxococcota bacterium]